MDMYKLSTAALVAGLAFNANANANLLISEVLYDEIGRAHV